MPFRGDITSMLEARCAVLLARDVDHRRARRSLSSRVAALISATCRAAASSSAPPPTPTEGSVHRATGDEPRRDPEEAEAFECALGADLASFEAGERLKGSIEAHQLDTLARMLATAEAELRANHAQSWVDRTPLSARETVTMEVATATGLGHREISLRLELAVGSASWHCFLREQVTTGSTTLQRACQVVEAARHLDDAAADAVARTALAPTRDGSGLAGALFRQRLRRATMAADADLARRRRAARQRLGVRAHLDEDGTGTLTITNDADKIAAAMDRAQAAARAARSHGDPRSLDELQADFLTGVAVHGWPDGDTGFGAIAPRPSGRVWVVVPATTALGLDDEPCALPGHGWVSAAHAREIMAAEDSIWQALLAEVDTGRALRLGRDGYRPSAAMIEHVRAVDGVCRGPGCTVPATQCDLDHDVPWPEGPTDVDHLTSKHRPHHRIRTAGVWRAARAPDDFVVWRTAAGRRYVTRPHDWLEAFRPATPTDPPPF
jgi:hypothetical protein